MAVARLALIVAVVLLTVIIGTATLANLMVRSRGSAPQVPASTNPTQPVLSTTTTTVATTTIVTTTKTSVVTTTTTTTITATSTQGVPAEGLLLRLNLNATSIASGGSIGMSVSDYNPSSEVLNLSKDSAWGANGLATGWCPSLYLPFGIAIFQGVYTTANVSEAKPLEIFPIVACPMVVMDISGYAFQPMSDNATILPGTEVAAMATGISANGTYGMAGTQINQLTLFAPGTYTVVAGDEWGNLAFAYFVVVT